MRDDIKKLLAKRDALQAEMRLKHEDNKQKMKKDIEEKIIESEQRTRQILEKEKIERDKIVNRVLNKLAT